MIDINPNFSTDPAQNPVTKKGPPFPDSGDPHMQAPRRGSLTIPQINAMTDRFLKDMKGGRKCFGGRLFRSKDSNYGNSLLVFAAENLSAELAAKHGGWYSSLTPYATLGFCPYSGSYKTEQYTFFTFSTRNDLVSLRELMDIPENRKQGVTVFKLLVRFLENYRDNFSAENPYIPLRCLSLDTIFFSTGGKDHTPYILPLRAVNNCYPEYYPGEVSGPYADLSTDLYTAALVATQLLSGQESEGSDGQAMFSDDSAAFLQQCMAPFRGWRPTMGDLLKDLELIESVGAGGRSHNSRPFRDASGNVVGSHDAAKKEGNLVGWVHDIKNKFTRGVVEPSEHRSRTMTRIRAGKINPAKSRKSMEADDPFDDYDADDYDV